MSFTTGGHGSLCNLSVTHKSKMVFGLRSRSAADFRLNIICVQHHIAVHMPDCVTINIVDIGECLVMITVQNIQQDLQVL